MADLGAPSLIVASGESYISDEMRAVVGTVMATKISFPVSISDIRKWAAAVYYPEVPPPLFWDEEYAATTRFGGVVAPEEFNPFAVMTHDPRPSLRTQSRGRFERAFGIEPPPARAILQTEIRVRYSGVRIRPGDIIRSTERIDDYFEREGRMGLQLYTTVSNEFTNQSDEQIKILYTVYCRYR
jgi:N-terminal half of MaoC dehydratase